MHSQPNDFALQSEEIWLSKMARCVYCSMQAAAADQERGSSCLSLPAIDLLVYGTNVLFHVFWGDLTLFGINSQNFLKDFPPWKDLF